MTMSRGHDHDYDGDDDDDNDRAGGCGRAGKVRCLRFLTRGHRVLAVWFHRRLRTRQLHLVCSTRLFFYGSAR